MRAAAGVDPWLPQPVLVILARMLDQRQGRHLLVLGTRAERRVFVGGEPGMLVSGW